MREHEGSTKHAAEVGRKGGARREVSVEKCPMTARDEGRSMAGKKDGTAEFEAWGGSQIAKVIENLAPCAAVTTQRSW